MGIPPLSLCPIKMSHQNVPSCAGGLSWLVRLGYMEVPTCHLRFTSTGGKRCKERVAVIILSKGE